MKTNDEKLHMIKAADLIILILLFGSLWGLSETVLGNMLHAAAAPVRAGLLTGVGMMMLGFFTAVTGRPLLLPAVALVTAAAMQLSAPILQCSLPCKVNSNLAVFIHASLVSSLMVPAVRTKRRSMVVYASIGFTAALASSLLFYHVGMRCAPCTYLLSFRGEGGLVRFLMKEGAVWALFSMLFFPAGIAAGHGLSGKLLAWRASAPVRFYGVSSAAIMACLVMIAASIQYWR